MSLDKTITLRINFILYLFCFFLIFNSHRLRSQENKLVISAIAKDEVNVLNKINYQKKHKDSASTSKEIKRVANYLKNLGYFTNTIDSISKRDNITITYFSLGKKIESAKIYAEDSFQIYFEKYEVKNDTLYIPIKKLQSFLRGISKKLDTEGKSFSKVRLDNIKVDKKIIFADLKIEESNKRIITKVIVKGYKEFPKSFLKNYFGLKKNQLFNQKKITQISSLSKNLNFSTEIKPPEVLFTKDSTLLYLYLKKQQNNSFDGIVNFSSNEDEGLLFNGNINLTLNNILNKGERFSLFWNSIANERQEFKLSTIIPYLFNSKFTPEISFNLYKQDSTFLNTKFGAKIRYNLNPKNLLALTYSSETSTELEEISENKINSFTNYFVGILFRHQKKSQNLLLGDKFAFKINPSFGSRKADSKNEQFQVESTLSYLLEINNRNYFSVKNQSGYLKSDKLLINELFRIGGVNSLRGFNEQEFFTDRYNYTNIEYRYKLSNTSLFYTITDIGFLNTVDYQLTSFGLGYRFFNEKFLINIGFALGNNNENQFKLNNSKILLNWTSIF